MIVDTSAILAVFFAEPHAEWVVSELERHAGELRMSTVNLTETLILTKDRQPQLFEELAERLLTSDIRFVAPDADQARVAADARLRYPLNLGDCFAYALASAEGAPILTLDEDFRAVDVPVVMPEL